MIYHLLRIVDYNLQSRPLGILNRLSYQTDLYTKYLGYHSESFTMLIVAFSGKIVSLITYI